MNSELKISLLDPLAFLFFIKLISFDLSKFPRLKPEWRSYGRILRKFSFCKYFISFCNEKCEQNNNNKDYITGKPYAP